MSRKIPAFVFLSLLIASVMVASSEMPVEPRVLNQVQTATRSFIDEQMVDGVYLYFHAATDELKRLEFKMLHPVVSREGDIYFTRADFFDGEGRPVNMRFLVVMRDNRPHMLQAVAHQMGADAAGYWSTTAIPSTSMRALVE